MMFTGNYVFMDYLGEAGVAAFSIACYLFPVLFSLSNAIAQSAQPIMKFTITDSVTSPECQRHSGFRSSLPLYADVL